MSIINNIISPQAASGSTTTSNIFWIDSDDVYPILNYTLNLSNDNHYLTFNPTFELTSAKRLRLITNGNADISGYACTYTNTSAYGADGTFLKQVATPMNMVYMGADQGYTNVWDLIYVGTGSMSEYTFSGEYHSAITPEYVSVPILPNLYIKLTFALSLDYNGSTFAAGAFSAVFPSGFEITKNQVTGAS